MIEGMLLAQVTARPLERELSSASPGPPAHLLDVSVRMSEAARACCHKIKQGHEVWYRKDAGMVSLT